MSHPSQYHPSHAVYPSQPPPPPPMNTATTLPNRYHCDTTCRYASHVRVPDRGPHYISHAPAPKRNDYMYRSTPDNTQMRYRSWTNQPNQYHCDVQRRRPPLLPSTNYASRVRTPNHCNNYVCRSSKDKVQVRRRPWTNEPDVPPPCKRRKPNHPFTTHGNKPVQAPVAQVPVSLRDHLIECVIQSSMRHRQNKSAALAKPPKSSTNASVYNDSTTLVSNNLTNKAQCTIGVGGAASSNEPCSCSQCQSKHLAVNSSMFLESQSPLPCEQMLFEFPELSIDFKDGISKNGFEMCASPQQQSQCGCCTIPHVVSHNLYRGNNNEPFTL
eukprot:49708_1